MSKVVSVGCKLPQGALLEVGIKVIPGGIIKGEKYKAVKLNGANQHAVIEGPLRTPSPAHLRPGITHGVDAEFMAQWMKEHRDTNLVKNHLIFVETEQASAVAHAEELATERTGLEPVDPSKHPGIKPLEKDAA